MSEDDYWMGYESSRLVAIQVAREMCNIRGNVSPCRVMRAIKEHKRDEDSYNRYIKRTRQIST